MSHGINCLGRLDVKIPLGYVPLGTTNDFARSLGLPKEPARAAEQILHGSAHRLDLGRFGDRAFLYVASFGAFTQSSYKAEPRVKAALGHLGLCTGKRAGAALPAAPVPSGGGWGRPL